ncbi:MAG: ABC transporter ATP-binding protein [Oscillospiraceae bacterium]|nr:ABC transporter ATP-binding protein [Oscillospiraceae bacterium]
MIKVENLVKRFGDKMAVNDISFTVEDGEIVGFLGPNGAGKSTTLNIMTGYLSSTSGSASIDGFDILESPTEAKTRIGFLPEQPPLYLDMTVEEYLNFIYDLKKCTLNRKKHIMEICDVVKISDVYKRIIRNLSKGYRQRVGIAQTLVGNPKVIIFDEPTIGLDPKQIIEIRNLIRMLGRDHTVILSTHILSEVQSVCDRIIIINKGKIVADQPTEDISKVLEGKRRYMMKICGPQKNVMDLLKSRQGVTYVETMNEHELDSTAYLIESEPGVDIRKTLFYALAENNYPIIGIEAMGVSLEDIFISLVDQTPQAKTKKKRVKTDPVKEEVQ